MPAPSIPREFADIFDSCGRHCSPNPTATEHWGLRSNLTGRPSGMRQGVCHGRLAAVSPFPAEIQVCTLEVPNSERFSSRASARGKGQTSSGTKQNFGTVPDPIPRDEVEVPSNYFYPGSLRRLGSTPAFSIPKKPWYGNTLIGLLEPMAHASARPHQAHNVDSV